MRNEGVLGLFKGVDASAARQLVYSGAPRPIYLIMTLLTTEINRIHNRHI